MSTRSNGGAEQPAKYHRHISREFPQDRALDEKFWLKFGDDPNPPTKSKMIYLTVEDVSRVGPAGFNVAEICDELGVAYSLVNFHFGNRDGLLAAATLFAYDEYVREVWERVSRAKQLPRERMRAWIEGSADNAARNAGWGAVINYPSTSLDLSGAIADLYGQELIDLGELNLARVMLLVGDMKKGTVSTTEPALGKLGAVHFLKNPSRTALAVSVMMATNGLAVWRGGRTVTEANRQKALEKLLTKTHVNRILDSLAP